MFIKSSYDAVTGRVDQTRHCSLNRNRHNSTTTPATHECSRLRWRPPTRIRRNSLNEQQPSLVNAALRRAYAFFARTCIASTRYGQLDRYITRQNTGNQCLNGKWYRKKKITCSRIDGPTADDCHANVGIAMTDA